jgi:hypothetical protein
MLVRLLYASRAAEALTGELIDAIHARSLAHNPRHGITGVLVHSSELFLQVLEGGRDEVCELYNAIARDERHTRVRILSYEEIGERRFGGWTMGRVDAARINPALLLKHAERAELDPFRGSARASMALLDELIASAALVARPG